MKTQVKNVHDEVGIESDISHMIPEWRRGDAKLEAAVCVALQSGVRVVISVCSPSADSDPMMMGLDNLVAAKTFSWAEVSDYFEDRVLEMFCECVAPHAVALHIPKFEDSFRHAQYPR